ncbi:MAG: HAD-IA family hydrolase [Robiginitomaculum sp.]|nr:HAD-IA family hydrolase [Robiginitomaculum sp.]
MNFILDSVSSRIVPAIRSSDFMTSKQKLTGKTIAFDLDGTLVDTAPDLIAALNHAMQNANHPTTPDHIVRDKIGHGAKALIIAAHDYHDLTQDQLEIEKLLQVFLQYYSQNSTKISKPFVGAIDCLEKLKNSGAKLTICTNKSEALTLPILHKLNMTDYFDGIFCADKVPAKKPDPAHIFAAIAPTKPKNSLMIGDSNTDLLAAKAASVDCFLLEHGYSEQKVCQLGATKVFSGFVQLTPEIFNWFS